MGNNNTQTIKQRVLDILFEDEPDYQSAKKEEVRRPEPVITGTKIKREESHIKASDLLYGKKDENATPFINLKEELKVPTNETKTVTETNDDVFVASPNISPIFGAIDSKARKSDDVTSIDYATVEKPESNYLDMVLSPIYGYDNRQANEARSSLEEPKVVKEVESVDITEDLFATLETKFRKEKEDSNNMEDAMTKTSEMDLFADFYLDKDE